MSQTSARPTPQGEAHDDAREFLGAINKRDHYIWPEDGWSSLRSRALGYLRDPMSITPKSLQDLVNRFLRRFGEYTLSEDPRVLMDLVEAFGTLEIELGEEAFALYPHKTFLVYFRARQKVPAPSKGDAPPHAA